MTLQITNPKALSLWLNTVSTLVRGEETHDLTSRQMAILLTVYLNPGPHTVRGLAERLGVSKPVITRALNTLGALGYLRRVRDESDRRNVFVAKTGSGQEFLEGFERNLEQARGGQGSGSEGGSRSSAARAAGERGLLFQNG